MESSVAAAPDPLVGCLLDGRYRLDSTLARGGMATVYLATDTRLDRTVAVKVMRPALAEDADFVARFAREARAAARLSSPEVVAVHDQGTDPATGTAYLVMEYVQGRTLREVIRERAPLPPGRALTLLEPVLRALAAAHAAGIVHRDVKPENVLLADDGRVKVADFGLARAVETSNLTATTGLLIGTVAYLAPEQVERGTADPRTDVYAAGVLLWELLTGVPPYAADSPLSVAYRHVHEDIPPPSTVVSGVPASVDDLAVRATRRDPAARPLDAGAFLAELRAVLSELPAGAVDAQPTLVVPRPPPPPIGAAKAPRRRRPGLIAAVLVAVLALLALLGGWYLGSGRYTAAPSVLRMSQVAAEHKLRATGLKVRIGPGVFRDDIPKGQVAAQDPKPNGRLLRGGTVTLTLSRGPDLRAVPTLVGSTEPLAKQALLAAGLTEGTVSSEFSTAPAGTVIRTDPPVGKQLRRGSAVSLVLSKGIEQLPVPNVQGKQQSQATAIVTQAGFTAAVVQVFSDTVATGVVADQSPSTGTAGRGSTITLQVSKGPQLITVPDLTGMDQNAAVAQLQALGLKARVLSIPGPGIVRNQSPGGGAKVRKGATVTLYVF